MSILINISGTGCRNTSTKLGIKSFVLRQIVDFYAYHTVGQISRAFDEVCQKHFIGAVESLKSIQDYNRNSFALQGWNGDNPTCFDYHKGAIPDERPARQILNGYSTFCHRNVQFQLAKFPSTC